jgi:hypothetical protein
VVLNFALGVTVVVVVVVFLLSFSCLRTHCILLAKSYEDDKIMEVMISGHVARMRM